MRKEKFGPQARPVSHDPHPLVQGCSVALAVAGSDSLSLSCPGNRVARTPHSFLLLLLVPDSLVTPTASLRHTDQDFCFWTPDSASQQAFVNLGHKQVREILWLWGWWKDASLGPLFFCSQLCTVEQLLGSKFTTPWS